jgi:putative peptidoglycan lipid II flippase
MRRLVRLGVPGVIAGIIGQSVSLPPFASPQDGAMPGSIVPTAFTSCRSASSVAIGVVLLPELARRRARRPCRRREQPEPGLRFAMLITLPAAIGLLAMPLPIIQVLFERGAFSTSDTQATAAALAAFAAGLPAFVLMKVFSPGFFAREDTQTPMYFAIASVGLNILGAIVLFPLLGHVGIALATTIASWVNTLLLGITLGRRGHFTVDAPLRRNIWRMIVASLVMGVAVAALQYYYRGWFTTETVLALRLLIMLAMIAVAGAIYFGLTFALGALTPSTFRRMVRR